MLILFMDHSKNNRGFFSEIFWQTKTPQLCCQHPFVQLNLSTFAFEESFALIILMAFFTSSLGGKKQRLKKKHVGGKNVKKTWGCPFFDVNFIEQIIGSDFTIEFALDHWRFWAGFSCQTFKKTQIPKREDGPNGQEVGNPQQTGRLFSRIELQPVTRYVWGFEIVQYHIIRADPPVFTGPLGHCGALRLLVPFSTPRHKNKNDILHNSQSFSSTQANYLSS